MQQKNKHCKYKCLSCGILVNNYSTMLCRRCLTKKHDITSKKLPGYRNVLRSLKMLTRRPVRKEEVHNVIKTEVDTN